MIIPPITLVATEVPVNGTAPETEGYHIIKVDDRKEGYIKPFKDAKADVLKAMRKEQLEAFKDELNKALEVKVYE